MRFEGQVNILGFTVQGLGMRVDTLRFSGEGFIVWGFRLCALGLRFSLWGLRLRFGVQDSGFGV